MNCVWSPGCCNRINHGCRAGLLGNLVTRWVGGSTQEPRLDKQMSSLVCIRICGSLTQNALTQALILRIMVWLLNGDSAHY